MARYERRETSHGDFPRLYQNARGVWKIVIPAAGPDRRHRAKRGAQLGGIVGVVALFTGGAVQRWPPLRPLTVASRYADRYADGWTVSLGNDVSGLVAWIAFVAAGAVLGAAVGAALVLPRRLTVDNRGDGRISWRFGLRRVALHRSKSGGASPYAETGSPRWRPDLTMIVVRFGNGLANKLTVATFQAAESDRPERAAGGLNIALRGGSEVHQTPTVVVSEEGDDPDQPYVDLDPAGRTATPADPDAGIVRRLKRKFYYALDFWWPPVRWTAALAVTAWLCLPSGTVPTPGLLAPPAPSAAGSFSPPPPRAPTAPGTTASQEGAAALSSPRRVPVPAVPAGGPTLDVCLVIDRTGPYVANGDALRETLAVTMGEFSKRGERVRMCAATFSPRGVETIPLTAVTGEGGAADRSFLTFLSGSTPARGTADLRPGLTAGMALLDDPSPAPTQLLIVAGGSGSEDPGLVAETRDWAIAGADRRVVAAHLYGGAERAELYRALGEITPRSAYVGVPAYLPRAVRRAGR